MQDHIYKKKIFGPIIFKLCLKSGSKSEYRGPFLTSPLGASFDPRGEVVPRDEVVPQRRSCSLEKVIPWG
jgi:hypothetical protein